MNPIPVIVLLFCLVCVAVLVYAVWAEITFWRVTKRIEKEEAARPKIL